MSDMNGVDANFNSRRLAYRSSDAWSSSSSSLEEDFNPTAYPFSAPHPGPPREPAKMDNLDFLLDSPPGDATVVVLDSNRKPYTLSGLNLHVISQKAPLLGATFEERRSGPRCSFEGSTPEAVVSLLRYLYIGDYILFDDLIDMPCSLLIHYQLYHFGELYDIPDLCNLARLHTIRETELSCSLGSAPPELEEGIRYLYSNLFKKEDLREIIVHYTIHCFIYHHLDTSPTFRQLAHDIVPFHRDLMHANVQRGFRDEGAQRIVQLPVCKPTPHPNAELEKRALGDFLYELLGESAAEDYKKKNPSSASASASAASPQTMSVVERSKLRQARDLAVQLPLHPPPTQPSASVTGRLPFRPRSSVDGIDDPPPYPGPPSQLPAPRRPYRARLDDWQISPWENIPHVAQRPVNARPPSPNQLRILEKLRNDNPPPARHLEFADDQPRQPPSASSFYTQSSQQYQLSAQSAEFLRRTEALSGSQPSAVPTLLQLANGRAGLGTLPEPANSDADAAAMQYAITQRNLRHERDMHNREVFRIAQEQQERRERTSEAFPRQRSAAASAGAANTEHEDDDDMTVVSDFRSYDADASASESDWSMVEEEDAVQPESPLFGPSDPAMDGLWMADLLRPTTVQPREATDGSRAQPPITMYSYPAAHGAVRRTPESSSDAEFTDCDDNENARGGAGATASEAKSESDWSLVDEQEHMAVDERN